MPTRRDLLKLALAVPAAELLGSALPARADAQEPAQEKAMASGTVMFADFEGGTWDGWKVEGDAFDPAPATDALFPGKMKGFGGKGFVCTFSPEKGYAATGKATSKEFTIEKPFITFKIGGGKFPGKACLNLVVEGEIVRTETGDGTGRLVDASWDVSELIGKKAHFEIVDATDSQQRGYVLVDDVAFADRSLNLSDLQIETGPLLEKFGIDAPVFVQRSTVPFRVGEINDLEPLFDFGISPTLLTRLINAVCITSYRIPHLPGRTIPQTAAILCDIAEKAISDAGVAKKTKFLIDWIKAEAICAYVFSNIIFDAEGRQINTPQYYANQERPFMIFSWEKPLAFCSGFSKITSELAFEAGLKCCTINGRCRWSNGEVADGDNHSWVLFDFGNNIRVPADVTPMHPIDTKNTSVKSKINWHCLPCTRRSWEIVMRMHWPSQIRWAPEGNFVSGGVPMIGDRGQHNAKMDIKLFEQNFKEWKSINDQSYWDLEKFYMNRTYEKYQKSHF